MSLFRKSIIHLEEENHMLKAQLARTADDIFQNKSLNDILTRSEEILIHVANDEHGTIKAVSESIILLGYTTDDLISGKVSYSDLIHPEDIWFSICAFRKNQKSQKKARQELRMKTKDSKWAWVTIVVISVANYSRNGFLVKVSNIFQPDHEILQDASSYMHQLRDNVLYYEDINELKKTQSELTGEQKRIQAIADHLPDCTLIRIEAGIQTNEVKLVSLGKRWTELTQLRIKKSLGLITGILRYIHPDDQSLFLEGISESIRKMITLDIEFRFIYRKREIKWFRLSAYPYPGNGKVILDGLISDITSAKQQEQELIAERNRYMAIGDNMTNSTLARIETDIPTRKIRFIYLSKTWPKISNLPIKKSLENFPMVLKRIHPDDLPGLVEKIKDSINNLATINTEFRFFYTKNEIRWGHLIFSPHIENDKIISDGLMSDITQRKQIERKLEMYRKELENRLRQQTIELKKTNEELAIANEELTVTNEELFATNEELHDKNQQLESETNARKLLIQQLEISEKLRKNFIEQSFEGIIIVNDKGVIIEWNAKMEEITKVRREKIANRQEWELSEKETRNILEMIRDVCSDYIRNHHQHTLIKERTFIMSDGTPKYIRTSLFPIDLHDEFFIGMISYDITEEKMISTELEQYQNQLEDMVVQKTSELRNSQEQLVSLSNNLPEGVIFQLIADNEKKLRFTFISDTVIDLFGVEADQVTDSSDSIFRLFSPDDRELVYNLFCQQNDNLIQTEKPFISDFGKKWVHIRSIKRFLNSTQYVWEGFMIDITKRKITEQELEKKRVEQTLSIDILQKIQTSALKDAVEFALSRIGVFLNISRVYTFVKDVTGTKVNNNFEWCNEGIDKEKDNLQDRPINVIRDWFDIFESGKYICTPDISSLSPDVYQVLQKKKVKSTLALPMVNNGMVYGFIGFEDCRYNRLWRKCDIDLLINLAQIISEAILRNHAESALRKSTQTLRTVLDNINAGIFVVDYDSTEILFANKKFKDRIDDQEMEGKTCAQMSENLKAPVSLNPDPDLTDRLKYPAGIRQEEYWSPVSHKWYECTDTTIEWINGRTVFMKFLTDITKRKKAEEALRQSEEMYRQLTIASPDAIIVCDPAMNLLYASPKARDLFLIDQESDIQNLSLCRYVHPHDRKQINGILERIDREDIIILPHLLMLREGKEEFFGEISLASVRNDNGKITSIVMVVRDITERKRSEIELIRAKEKAEEADNLKSAFLANMSHEIRTPLNGINGFLNFLDDDNMSHERRKEFISIIKNSSDQLIKLIDDIIDLAKIEARQMKIRPTPFHLNRMMREMQLFFETSLRSNHKDKVSLILDDRDFIDHCVLFIDPVRLSQVLTNLMGNAVKFTSKGYIRFGYRQIGPDMLEFVVEDTGIGLDENQAGIIFERFRQAENKNSQHHHSGTGLGLTISKSLVQMMGGDIRVRSVPGEGASFSFTVLYIPVCEEEELLLKTNEAGNEQNNNTSVLIVEPQILKYKYYEALLSASGISVLYARDTHQWLEHISQSGHIDLVLVNSRIISEGDGEDIRQIRSIRTDLPMALIAGIDDRNQYPDNNQYFAILKEPVDYNQIKKIRM